MEFTGVGGGIMLAIAAVLWLAYLLPNWLKRREYLATERNAVRLQQTIRVLAETAQVPEVVKAARSAPFPVAVGRTPAPPPPVDPRLLGARRIRRARGLSTLLLAAAVLLGGIQVSLMIATGAVAGSWLVVAVAALAAVTAVAMLGRLAERSRSGRVDDVRPTRRTSLGTRPVTEAAAPVADRAWTPVTVPKPLYLSKPDAPAVVPMVDLERATAQAEAAQRAAEERAAQLRPAAQAMPDTPTSRFARMGFVDDAAPVVPDLDAALARRRAAAG
jgi:hypothetical protein